MNGDIFEMAKAFSLERLLTPEELAEYYKTHPERKTENE